MNFTPSELRAHQRLAETGLSAAELLALPMDEYARITGRPTPTQAALAALDAADEQVPGTPRQEPAPPQLPEQMAGTPEPQGIDVSALDMTQYAQLRGQLGMGGGRQEGRGIFDSVGSQSAEYIAAARAQAGRTAMSTSNVTPSPAITRPVVRPDVPLDTRTVAERFSLPGSAWQG